MGATIGQKMSFGQNQADKDQSDRVSQMDPRHGGARTSSYKQSQLELQLKRTFYVEIDITKTYN